MINYSKKMMDNFQNKIQRFKEIPSIYGINQKFVKPLKEKQEKAKNIISYSRSVRYLLDECKIPETEKISKKAIFNRIEKPLGDDCENIESIKNSFANNIVNENKAIEEDIPSEKWGEEESRYQFNNQQQNKKIFPKPNLLNTETGNKTIKNNSIFTIPARLYHHTDRSIQVENIIDKEYDEISEIEFIPSPRLEKLHSSITVKIIENQNNNKLTLNKNIEKVNKIQLSSGGTPKRIENLHLIDYNSPKKDTTPTSNPKKMINKFKINKITNFKLPLFSRNHQRLVKSTSVKFNSDMSRKYQHKSSMNDMIYPSLQSKFKFSPTFYSPKKNLEYRLDANLCLALAAAAQTRSIKSSMHLSESMSNTVCLSQSIDLGSSKLISDVVYPDQKGYQI